MEAITREEQYLSAIAEGTDIELTPITRKELFLAKAGGQDVTTPTPITREEMFLSKIQPGGSGGTTYPTIDALLNHAYPSGDLVAVSATAVSRDAFMNNTTITSFKSDTVKSIGEKAFYGCTSLVSVDCPYASIAGSAFEGCSSLKTVNLIGEGAGNYALSGGNIFKGCIALERFRSKTARKMYGGTFAGCTALKSVDWTGGSTSDVRNDFIADCTALETLVCRGSGVTVLNGIAGFANTPFGENGAGGILLVPANLKSNYESHTNWSALIALGNTALLTLEDYTVDGTVDGDIDWDKVAETLASIREESA